MKNSQYRLLWTPTARDDLDEILDYIAERDCVEAAVSIYGRILDKIDSLAMQPRRCRVPAELRGTGVTEYRELIIRPYGVFFRIQDQTVAIVAVLDRRRDMEELLVQRLLR